MKTLWFKGCYVAPILSGEKRQTYRDLKAARRFVAGEIIGASVGPRPAFARLAIESVDIIPFDELPRVEQADALATYGSREPQVCIRFQRVVS